jgi:hypothetical protein
MSCICVISKRDIGHFSRLVMLWVADDLMRSFFKKRP